MWINSSFLIGFTIHRKRNNINKS
ncbi:hypothetical protein Bhyg_02715 [Pseudolycoriella hygida]|uniref:Uncharacterized protein n=1 Tax=Pseudolycoriella hygida TaxID=35572 RepID=A0A9Q0NBY8_9DIPT|nr:hypothetical protein Bhyg_02715 [Pseudolycoriella hygida]